MDIKYKVIKALLEQPNINQRSLAKDAGVSLGKINGVIKTLIQEEVIVINETTKGVKYEVTQRGNDELFNALINSKKNKLIINKEQDYKVKQAVILAAGKSEFDIPVGGLTLDESTIIQRLINNLKENGISKIVVVTGYKREFYYDLLKNESGIVFVDNNKYKWTGTMKSLQLAKEYITDDFLLVEGDLVLEYMAIAQVLNNKHRDCILITNESGSGDEAFVQLDGNNLFKLAKDVHQFNRIDGEMIGVMKISLKLFNMMLKEYEHNINPYLNYEYMILDMSRNYKVSCVKLDDLLWGEIDTKKQYEVINNKLYAKIKRKDLEFEKEKIKNIICGALDIDKVKVKDIIPAGGLTNKNYKVSIEDEAFILRVPGVGTEKMISRHNELENSTLASKKGYNAEILYFNEDNGIKISKYIEGAETLTGASAKKEENMILVTNILRELHNSDVNMSNVFDVFEELEKYEEILSEKNVKYYDGYEQVKDEFYKIKYLMSQYDSVLVPSHNDTVPENFIKDINGSIYLIDWEYSGLNDEMWDLAAHSIECNFSEDDEELFLNLYFNGEVDRNSRIRILMNKICQDFLWSVWTLVKEVEGDDFGSYGLDRFNRARKNIINLLEEVGTRV